MNYIYAGNSQRVITFEYCITYHNNKPSVSCFRQDTGALIGDFINVATMKAYAKRLYALSKIKFIRLYEKEVQDGEEV